MKAIEFESFRSKVKMLGGGKGCWVWKGGNNGRYGCFHIPGTGKFGGIVYAHRFAYECSNGTIPEGLEIDHLCRTTLCVRPSHLEAVTHLENCLRGDGGKHMSDRSNCANGHEFTPANTYVRRRAGRRPCRRCRTCALAQNTKSKARHRAALQRG